MPDKNKFNIKIATLDRLESEGGIAYGPCRMKTCLWGFRQGQFKPVSSATGTSYKIEISSVASLHMILSKNQITKALIRLR